MVCRSQTHRRHEGERVDGALEVLVTTILRAHDDDEPDIAHRIERFGRPGENGLARYLDELLAAFLAETLAGAAGENDGSRLGLLIDHAFKARDVLAESVEVQIVEGEHRLAQRLGLVNRIDDLGHGKPPDGKKLEFKYT